MNIGLCDMILLPARREHFAREFIVDHNATAAAKRAGYAVGSAAVTGHRLLMDVNVASRIAELHVEQRHRLNYSADRVVAMMERAYWRAMASGRPLAAMDAAERIGRHLGMFRNNVSAPIA